MWIKKIDWYIKQNWHMEALILLIFSIKFVNGVFIILFLKKSMYIFSWNALLVGKLVHH